MCGLILQVVKKASDVKANIINIDLLKNQHDMKYLNYGLANISIVNLIDKSNDIINKMSDNPHFKRPYPSLIEIQALSEELTSLNNKVNDGQTNQIRLLQERFVSLKRKLKQLGTFVAIKSQGNPFIVKTSGFEISEKPETVQDLFICK